ncbi:hypothetical protein [Amycolatopsis sp. NPDC021455]|uniref:hypothetical protein n=1 Tax=Amycolatopsis sp. NPDC021455 TaxID=3154901 RepID=UPI0034038A7F
MSRTWPWPADTVLERARRVAQIYRHHLLRVDPDVCADLDAAMAAMGQPWVVPSRSTYVDTDLLTADLAAAEMRVARRTIYAWREQGLRVIATPDGPRYRVDDLRQFVSERRRLRSQRRKR